MIDIIGWRITPAAYGFRIFLRKISDFQPIVQPRRQICLPSLSLCTVLLFAETHQEAINQQRNAYNESQNSNDSYNESKPNTSFDKPKYNIDAETVDYEIIEEKKDEK